MIRSTKLFKEFLLLEYMGLEKEDEKKAEYILDLLKEAEKQIGEHNSDSLFLYSRANQNYRELTKINGKVYRKDLGNRLDEVWAKLMDYESY